MLFIDFFRKFDSISGAVVLGKRIEGEGSVRLTTPLNDEDVMGLKAGDSVLISGVVYGARDAAHRRFAELIASGDPLPFPVKGSVIYYVGPTPAPKGTAILIGSAGPTTAARMDRYAPGLYSLGLKGTIGKGERGDEVKGAIVENNGVYFAATGGAGALLSLHIESVRVIAYEELGPEALFEFKFADFPAVVAIDCHGNDIFSTCRERYAI
jgi:fumarate hydratase subunit beta